MEDGGWNRVGANRTPSFCKISEICWGHGCNIEEDQAGALNLRRNEQGC